MSITRDLYVDNKGFYMSITMHRTRTRPASLGAFHAKLVHGPKRTDVDHNDVRSTRARLAVRAHDIVCVTTPLLHYT